MESVYEWEVDFFHINKGDKFKIIFEETQIDGEAIGVARILGAYFQYGGQDNYAIFFEQDEKDDYFDEKGKSLRKALLKAPLKFSRISSRFSRSRYHPVLKRYRPHSGVDYAAPRGTPVRAVGAGTVIKASYSGGAGKYVKIKHNSTYTTGYMHLSGYGSGIKVGKKVKQSDVIGYVGSTGLSTGPHLDYRIWRNGVNINPLTLKLPPAKGIDSCNVDSFNIIRDEVIQKLDKIDYPPEKANISNKKD
jgi:murein DD-endopeptidase MepM/ murein hydrolase activator NlpD